MAGVSGLLDALTDTLGSVSLAMPDDGPEIEDWS